ncbi:MAG TPA: LPS export ABC transporter permease LptF [Caulobacteraceae bacterium]|nr:LPS export ABC transporter permease LptF [Caulobacteraceae bacterium]
MRLIDRYLFRQLLGPTVLATAALTGVAVLTSSLSALDLMVSERQTALIFAEVTLLATPQIIAMILPLAVFVAGLVALNRLHTEQEIVICFAGGMSRWRVASPAIRLSLMAAIATLVINLWIQPLCFRQLRHVLDAVRADIAATLIEPGQFTHPAPGLTVYAQSVGADGAIKNIFIDQTRRHGDSTTLMAGEGRIAERDGEPVLILHNGSNQEFSKTGVLNTLYWDEYLLDLRPFLALETQIRYHASDRYLHELFFPDLRHRWERNNRAALLAEGNARLASPLYNLAFMSLALAAVLGGAFSRLGYGVRIAAASAAAVGVRVLGFVAAAASASQPSLDILQYSAPLICVLVSLAIVLRQHPARGPAMAAPAAMLATGRPA